MKKSGIATKPIGSLYISRKRSLLEILLSTCGKNDIIEPIVSPYANPILLVRKKNGQVRMCVNYRKLYTVTVKDKYPLPNIEGNTCCNMLDLISRYHQLKVAEANRP